MNELINDYDVYIFDVCLTLMFNVDRFDDNQDYYATYSQLGGSALDRETVQESIATIWNAAIQDYRDPAKFDNYPKLRYYIDHCLKDTAITTGEKDLLAKVIATHEAGQIPQEIAETIKKLHGEKQLGIISNITSEPELFLKEFERVEIRSCFEHIIFSSEYGAIKPSEKLFHIALESFKVPVERIVYIGDSYNRDVIGAKKVGMGSVLLTDNSTHLEQLRPEAPRPDYILPKVSSLLDLVS